MTTWPDLLSCILVIGDCMMFSVFRCVNDCGEVFRQWVADFENENEAQWFAEAEERADVSGVFYIVETV